MTIDAHQHFWTYVPTEYPWITDALQSLRRDFLPGHLATERAKNGIDGSIAVQARQTLTESRWLLQLAEQNPSILGVVGWVDLRTPEVDAQLQEFVRNEKFVGVRHVLQDEPDDRFMLQPEFRRGISRLSTFQLTYDLLIYPRQLSAALELVEQFPDQPFVIDHLAKPNVRGGHDAFAEWRNLFVQFRSRANVWCKLSGLVTETTWHGWQPADFQPYIEVALETFGEDRLMFGSDWPVCLLSADYSQVVDIIRRQVPAAAHEKIFGRNAARFYLGSPG